LLTKRLQHQLSAGEAAELEEWAKQSDLYRQVEQELSDPQAIVPVLKIWNQWDDAAVARRLQSRFPAINFVGSTRQSRQRAAHRVHFLKTAWFRYAAAVIILLGIGGYLWNAQQKDKSLITQTEPVPVKNDILPGSDRAVLTLSSGQQVILDNSASETINDGTLSIENNNGQLIYKQGDRMAMNTMRTPKGGQYQLALADGTRVWLNAASSITYPTSFSGVSREVMITGEAYFEVTRNAKQPFIVKTPKENVTVLGTSFNVNAYADEPAMKTSLLEGSVRIAKTVLKPGQAYQEGKVIPTNVDQDVAWKNGFFSFEDVSLQQALKQFARWYDVEIVYDDKIPEEQLSGGMDRSLTLQNALKGLEGVIAHFRVEGRTVHVQPL
jgi:hypothetical protein